LLETLISLRARVHTSELNDECGRLSKATLLKRTNGELKLLSRSSVGTALVVVARAFKTDSGRSEWLVHSDSPP
jgi:hypothetical protein